jgi:O-antigen ligase
MRRAHDLPYLTPAAGLLAVLAAMAWVRLGPVVPVLVALPMLAMVLLSWRWDASALLLPLCLVPFAVNAGGVYASASDLLTVGLGCCLLLATAAGFERQQFANPLTVPALAFVAWTLLSATWAAEPLKAVVDAGQRLEFTVLGVALFAGLPLDGRHIRRTLGGFVSGATALAVVTVIVGLIDGRFVGVYPLGIHKNAAGSLLSYGLLAAVGLRLIASRKAICHWLVAASLTIAAGLVFTGSRGAWVGTLVAMAAMVVLRHRQLLWPVTSITLVAVAMFLLVLPPETLADQAGFDERYSTASVRLDTWSEGVQAIAADPLLGVGAGNFIARIDGKNFQADPNNVVLLTWAETGLPGLLLLLWLFGACLRLAWRNAIATPAPDTALAASQIGVAMLISAVVHGQFDVFWTRGTGLAAFLGVGLVAWAHRALANGRSRRPSDHHRDPQPAGRGSHEQ